MRRRTSGYHVIVATCIFGIVGCGVRGRPEPPLLRPPEKQVETPSVPAVPALEPKPQETKKKKNGK